ncbi:MAG TPA: hypothetical protein VGO68_01050 [Pyrinomonadaceae bacterium]|jgi:hypothetical protein|nr:hypothetical protein [Pyrinomonadaceae bacterium]
MKSPRNGFLLLVLVLLCGLSVSALTAPGDKEFNKDGLSFNYPDGWAFNDTSDKDAQKLTFGRTDSEAQISIFVDRDRVTKPEHVAEAKKVLVDKYVAATFKSLQTEDPKATNTPATSEIGGLASEGVKIHAALGGAPGTAEIQWAVIGERWVVLTLFTSDQALKQATPAWDTIRNSIKIAGKTPEPAASPKP